MGNKSAKEQEAIKQQILLRLHNKTKSASPEYGLKDIGKEMIERAKIGKDIIAKPSLKGILPNVGKAALREVNVYKDMITGNSQLRKERQILEDLVREKRKKKAAALGISEEEVKKRADESRGGKHRKEKWNGTDTRNLMWGGPWGLIATGVRHKRQNDINDLEDEFTQLENEGYGYIRGRGRRKVGSRLPSSYLKFENMVLSDYCKKLHRYQ